jgi:hypothetical protein
VGSLVRLQGRGGGGGDWAFAEPSCTIIRGPLWRWETADESRTDSVDALHPYASTSHHRDLIKHRRTRSRNGLFRQRELSSFSHFRAFVLTHVQEFTFLDNVSLVGV